MESEEDENEIIEQRRKQRQAIVNKYAGITSEPVSLATSVTSKASDSDSSSSSSDESDDSNTVEKRATEDFEEDMALSRDQKQSDSVDDSKDDTTDVTSKDAQESSKNGDMFAVDDMFSENYSVSPFDCFLEINLIIQYNRPLLQNRRKNLIP